MVFSDPYRSELRAILNKIGYDYDIEIVELEIPIDHIHMIVRAEPTDSPSRRIQVIKSIQRGSFFGSGQKSSDNIFEEENCGRRVIS